jgi:hypothetical protein
MSHRKTTTILLAASVTAALVAAGVGAASGTPHARSTLISTPKLTVTISKGSLFHVKGPRHFSAGRVDVTLIAKKGEQEVGFVRLHPGYTYAHAKHDFNTFGASESSQTGPTAAEINALDRLVKHVTFYGGIDSGTGHKTVTGSVVLPKAGTYLVLDDENSPFAVAPVRVHVTKRAGSRTTPPSTALVRTLNAKRFAGATTLPADGTITFKNTATNSPHLLVLNHVKKGTTRKQVITGLMSSQGPPSFALPGGIGADVLSPGQSQTLTYNLPKGDYAEMCFFPDLKTGIPHAFMGMVRIVHLK